MISPLLIAAMILSALYMLMVIYFLAGWLRLKSPAPTIADSELPFVSVVIPVRNEADYIKQCMEAVFKQNYPKDKFELIVIDDYSTDNSLEVARAFTEKNLLVLDLQQYLGNPGEYSPNKKKALALGVKNAAGDLIITTDGDCLSGENWLRTMAGYYQSSGHKLITGPVLIMPARNPLAWFQQMDVITMLGITGATIRNDFPTMCNGANLMYSKKVFQDVEGFKGNHEVPTGDDIFLMHKINQKYPGSIGFVKSMEACVSTKAEKGLKGFVDQRVRWISKSRQFSDIKVTLVLLFAYAFNFFIIIAAAQAIQPGEMTWLPIAVAGGAKLFIDLVFSIPVTWFFRKVILLLLLPVIEIFHVLYVVIIGALSLSGRYRWKDRLIR